jgi:hypothetical protein
LQAAHGVQAFVASAMRRKQNPIKNPIFFFFSAFFLQLESSHKRPWIKLPRERDSHKERWKGSNPTAKNLFSLTEVSSTKSQFSLWLSVSRFLQLSDCKSPSSIQEKHGQE